jgi:hypothetical protein
MELGERIGRPSARSRRAVELKIRLDSLAAGFEVTPAFIPSDQKGVDQLHAFRVLAHAEIEAYIEDVTRLIVDITDSRVGLGVLTHAGHHLVVARSVKRAMTRGDADKARYPWFESVEAAKGVLTQPNEVRSAIQQHRSLIDSNHGVRASNVRSLLLPLGYREHFFVPGFLDRLDDLGASRGAVAHTSGVVGAVNWPSGSTELAGIRAVLPGLAMIDRYVPRLLLPV